MRDVACWLTKFHLISFISRFHCTPPPLCCRSPRPPLPLNWSEVSCDKCRNWVASTCHTEGEGGRLSGRGLTVTKLSHCLSEQVKSSAKFWLYCYCYFCGFCCLVSRLIYDQQFKPFYIYFTLFLLLQCSVNCFACHFVASCSYCCCCSLSPRHLVPAYW